MALNKGAVLLYFPVLIQFLSIEEFGVWSLVFVLSRILGALMCLGGYSSVLRESAEDKSVGFSLLFKYVIISFTLCIAGSGVIYPILGSHWLLFAVLLGGYEAVFNLVTSYFRGLNFVGAFFVASLMSVAALSLATFYAYFNELNLFDTLATQIGSLFAVMLTVIGYLYFTGSRYRRPLSLSRLRLSLIFSIALIPHSLLQWVFTSSDRFIIKYIVGEGAVGAYSIAYNVALVLMVINSAIALFIQPYMIKHHDYWTYGGGAQKGVQLYTVAAVALFMGLSVVLYMDNVFFQLLGINTRSVFITFAIAYIGLFYLGGYYFFVSTLFYHRKGGSISRITSLAAVVNIILTIVLVTIMGIVGAAAATLATYVLYLFLVRSATLKIEPELNLRIRFPLFAGGGALSVAAFTAYNFNFGILS